MKVHRVVVLAIATCLSVAAWSTLEAQAWEGPAAVGLRVTDEDGQPIADAQVMARLSDADDLGPPVAATDAGGRIVLSGLREGEWFIEVSHQGYMLYAAYIDLRAGKKPQVGFSSQVNTATSWKPMTVKFQKASTDFSRARAPKKTKPKPPKVVRESPPQRQAEPPKVVRPQPEPPKPEPPKVVRPEPEPAPIEAAAPAVEEPTKESTQETAVAEEPQPTPEKAITPPPTKSPAEAVEPSPIAETTGEQSTPAAEPESEMPEPEPTPSAQPEPPPPVERPVEPSFEEPVEVETVEPIAPEAAVEATAKAPAPPEPEMPAATMEAPAEGVEDLVTAAPQATPRPSEETPATSTLEAMPEEPPAEELSLDEVVVDPPAVAAIPADEAPEDETPASEAPVDDLPTDETPAEVAPTDETPVGAEADDTAATVPAPVAATERATAPPSTTPPSGEAAAAAPTVGRLPRYLRSAAAGTCSECQPGEWAVATEQEAARAGDVAAERECSAEFLAGVVDAAQRLADTPGARLDNYTGPILTALFRLDDGQSRELLQDMLGAVTDPQSNCQMAGIVLPNDAAFSGYVLEAWDSLGGRACRAKYDCGVGQARWLDKPEVVQGSERTVVYSIFKNRSTRRERRLRMTIYFRPGSEDWAPRTR